MLPKNDVILHVNNIHGVVLVVFSKILKNFELHSRLVVVLLFIFDNFKRHRLLRFVVEALDSDAEGTLPQEGLDFVPEANMVLCDYLIVPLLVVKVVVVFVAVGRRLHFLDPKAEVVNLWVVQNFTLLVRCKVRAEVLQCFSRSYRELDILQLHVAI